jgi:hypothetical protein
VASRPRLDQYEARRLGSDLRGSRLLWLLLQVLMLRLTILFLIFMIAVVG